MEVSTLFEIKISSEILNIIVNIQLIGFCFLLFMVISKRCRHVEWRIYIDKHYLQNPPQHIQHYTHTYSGTNSDNDDLNS